MRSFLRLLTLGIALLGGAPGCSLLPAPPPSAILGDAAPTSPPPGVTVDESRIPTADQARTWATVWGSGTPEPLTAAECACRAIEQAQLAAVLDREASHLRSAAAGHPRTSPSPLLPDILADEARRQRNDAAQQALIAYYRLAEIALQQQVLAESYEEQRRTQDTLDALHRAAVLPDYDRTQLERQRLRLDQQSLQLSYDRTRLTAQVKALTGQDPLTPAMIETRCVLEPRPPGYGLPEALEIGRAHDVELNAMRRFLQQGDVDDLDAARSLLQTINPLLGQSPLPPGPLVKLLAVWGHASRGEQELSLRCRQLRTLYAARRQEVDLKVASALLDVEQRYIDVGLARDISEHWQRRVELLASNRDVLQSTYQELVKARAESLQARSNLLHQIVELEVAHVRLDGALGILGSDYCRSKSTLRSSSSKV